MPLTNAYRDSVVAQSVGEAVTPFNNASAHIGVGDSAAAFAAGQTNLQAATNVARRAVDSGYPTRAGNAMTFRATFPEAEANFAWNEWAVFNAATGGTMLNRKVESLGTKPDTQAWQFTVTVTVNVPAS